MSFEKDELGIKSQFHTFHRKSTFIDMTSWTPHKKVFWQRNPLIMC